MNPNQIQENSKVSLDRFPCELQKFPVIAVVVKNILPPVSPGGDVINGIGKLNAKRPCHGFPPKLEKR